MMYSRNMISHLKCISFYSLLYCCLCFLQYHALLQTVNVVSNAIDTISRYLFERPYIIIANYYHKIGHP